SRLTHFIQTGVHGKGLRAQRLRIANPPVSNEVAAADQSRSGRFFQGVSPSFDRIAGVELHFNYDTMEECLIGIVVSADALISVEVGQHPQVRSQLENVAFHAVSRVNGKNGAGMIAEIVERAWSAAPADMPCSGAKAARHRMPAVSAKSAIDEKVVRYSFHSFRQLDQAVFI